MHPLRRRILAQSVYLTIAKGFNTLFPILVYPILYKKLGASSFGQIVFFQSICLHLSLLVEYGFNWSATREVSISSKPSDEEALFCAVLTIRISICLILLLFTFPFVWLIKSLNNPVLYLISFGACLAAVVNPNWWYQAKFESFRWVVFIGVARIVSLVLVLKIVHSEKDTNIAALLLIWPMALAGVISVIEILVRNKFRWNWTPRQRIERLMREGWPIFAANYMAQWVSGAGTMVLGLFCAPHIVGEFGIIEKVVKGIQSLFEPISQVLYPYLSRQYAESMERGLYLWKKIFERVIYGLIPLITLLLVCGVWLGPKLLSFWRMETAIVYIILVLFLGLGILNNMIGIQFGLASGEGKWYAKIMLKIGLISFIVIWLMASLWGQVGIALSVFCSETILLLSLLRGKSRIINNYRKLHA